MDSGYSTIRNLLFIVLALTALGVASNFYVAMELSRNSDELAGLRLVLQKQLMGEAMTKADELQKKMDALNQTAGGIDGKLKQAEDDMDASLKKAQDDFVVRMQVELPKIMDNYVQQRAPALQKKAEQQLQKRGVAVPQP